MGSIVRHTIGPLGLDSMIVRRMPEGEIRAMVTNDASAIIEEFEGETDHPIAQRFIYLARAHEDDYGDGATRTVLLASELIDRGLDLIDRGVHPHDTIEGFMIGGQRTLELWEAQAISLQLQDGSLDREGLTQVTRAGIANGRPGAWDLDGTADLVVEAGLRVSVPEEQRVDLSSIDTVAIPGGGVGDSALLDGVVLPQDPVVAERLLPVRGGVLLVAGDLTVKSPFGMDVRIGGESWSTGAFSRSNVRAHASVVDRIDAADVVAVIVSGDVSHDMANELAGRGIVCLRNTTDIRMKRLSRVTGGRILGGMPAGALPTETIGAADIRRRDVGPEKEWTEVRALDHVPAVGTVVARGGTERSAKEAERRIKQGLNAFRAAIGRPDALPAGGAIELEAAGEIRSFASKFGGRKQLAIDTYADAIEAVPRALAENAGRDPIDAITDLRTRHRAGHSSAGFTADGVIVDDVTTHHAIEPFLIPTSALVRAIDFAATMLRIDSILPIDQLAAPVASSDELGGEDGTHRGR